MCQTRSTEVPPLRMSNPARPLHPGQDWPHGHPRGENRFHRSHCVQRRPGRPSRTHQPHRQRSSPVHAQLDNNHPCATLRRGPRASLEQRNSRLGNQQQLRDRGHFRFRVHAVQIACHGVPRQHPAQAGPDPGTGLPPCAHGWNQHAHLEQGPQSRGVPAGQYGQPRLRRQRDAGGAARGQSCHRSDATDCARRADLRGLHVRTLRL
uniref:(northern house mosquito) hypothetical protein n=1 Tax=Culex pipiens TaxID=7175 RepID=A0A8D8MYK6_CULPI